MTTPPAVPEPTVPPFPLPAPSPPAPAPPAAPSPDGDSADELRATLERERNKTRDVERQLAQLRQQGMSDQERAIADAKEAGRVEAARAAGLRVAAAEFRALAAGKLANPDKMLEDEDLNLGRFVNDQ